MNTIVKKLLLAGDFMLQIHLRQSRFTYSTRILFMEDKKEIQKN